MVFTIKVARPGFWTTSLWFYLLPLGQRHMFGSWTFWLGCFYVTFPLGLLIYGWNDLVDAETDRLNPRKGTFLFGARPDAAQLAALPARIFPRAIAVRVFVRLVWKARGPSSGSPRYALPPRRTTGPRPGFKGRPPFDVLNQTRLPARVRAQFSWLNRAPQLPWQTFAVRRAVRHALAPFRSRSWTWNPTALPGAGPRRRSSARSRRR